MNPIYIALLLSLGILTLIIGFSARSYEKSKKNTRTYYDEEDWLFYNFSEKFYDALFPNKHPDEIMKQFGINVEDYYNTCELIEVEPRPKRMAAHCIFGLLGMLAFFILAIFSSVYFIFAGVAVFFFAIMYEKKTMNKKAEDMRYQVQCELPDFLDLLSSELAIGLPIEQAIHILSMKIDNQLSKEFLGAMNQTELGASSWLQALEKVAVKYDIETLNDFVSKLSIAYSKGISIADTVYRESRDIKESHLLLVKEKAGKMTNSILIPIALLQFVPLIGLILIPALTQVKGF